MTSRPTKRAPDWWDSARFQASFLAQAGSVNAASSRLAHQWVTQAVSQQKIERLETHAPRQRRGGARLEGTFDSSAVAWCYGVTDMPFNSGIVS